MSQKWTAEEKQKIEQAAKMGGSLLRRVWDLHNGGMRTRSFKTLKRKLIEAERNGNKKRS